MVNKKLSFEVNLFSKHAWNEKLQKDFKSFMKDEADKLKKSNIIFNGIIS